MQLARSGTGPVEELSESGFDYWEFGQGEVVAIRGLDQAGDKCPTCQTDVRRPQPRVIPRRARTKHLLDVTSYCSPGRSRPQWGRAQHRPSRLRILAIEA